MRIVAFITLGADIWQILVSLGADSEPPRISPAHGPALWEDCDAQPGEGVEVEQLTKNQLKDKGLVIG